MNSVMNFPSLAGGKGSLMPLEKHLLGTFLFITRPRTVVELGVYEAVSTRFMLEFLALNGIDGRVYGFDLTDVVDGLRERVPELSRAETEGRLQLIGGRLPNTLRDWLSSHSQGIDLALVDATHDYSSVSGELALLWQALSPDGVILCHDYSAKYSGVRYAVDEFARRNGVHVLSLMTGERAEGTAQHSVLVALRRRPYQTTTAESLHHHWLKTKRDLTANPVFRSFWGRVRWLVKGTG